MISKKHAPSISMSIDPSQFRSARMPDQYENIRVLKGSEETVFNEVYVTGLLVNNRVVRFNKSALVFKNDN